jgi:hypothetical protein
MLNKNQFNEIVLFKFEQEKNREVLEVESLRTSVVYPPELEDLFRLYAYVIDNCVTSILEFGAGWSTLALSMGLQHNKDTHSTEYPNYDRNPHPFSICSVDNSENFMARALSRLDPNALELVSPHLAKPRMSWVGIHPVTTWVPIPRFDYDFIYLDAPEPEQVVGGPEFIQMQSVHDLPIAGDLLINEPYILPQTSIIVDGRTSNARYLISNFYRNWESMTDFDRDFTLLHLIEPPLGKINQRHFDFRVERSARGNLNYLRE